MLLKPAKDSIDIGLVVGDIRASLNFYENLLGLKKAGEMPLPFGMLHRLQYGTSDVKLVDPKAKPKGGAIGLDKQLGFRYLTFLVTNLEEICRRLEGEKIEFTVPRTELIPGLSVAMVKDPDGNIVEFVERR